MLARKYFDICLQKPQWSSQSPPGQPQMCEEHQDIYKNNMQILRCVLCVHLPLLNWIYVDYHPRHKSCCCCCWMWPLHSGGRQRINKKVRGNSSRIRIRFDRRRISNVAGQLSRSPLKVNQGRCKVFYSVLLRATMGVINILVLLNLFELYLCFLFSAWLLLHSCCLCCCFWTYQRHNSLLDISTSVSLRNNIREEFAEKIEIFRHFPEFNKMQIRDVGAAFTRQKAGDLLSFPGLGFIWPGSARMDGFWADSENPLPVLKTTY